MGRQRVSVLPGLVPGRKRGRPKGSGGRKPGALSKTTITANAEKEALRQYLRAKVAARWEPLINAQLDNAIGLKHLMLRDPKTGKFEHIKEEADIARALASDGETHWIYTKDPNSASAIDLFNRVIDKPIEPVEADVGGTIVLRWEGE